MYWLSPRIDKILNIKIYIFGAGKRGIDILRLLVRNNIKVECFIDNDQSKIGKKIEDVEVVELHSVPINGDVVVVVSPEKNDEIYNQIEEYGLEFVIDGEELLFFYPVKEKEEDYSSAHPFNHYESPYPDLRTIRKHEKEVFDTHARVRDIDFNVDRQIELINQMRRTQLVPWDRESNCYRYSYNNDWFGKGSADVLCYMMQIIRPKRIIEVGSGYSTAVMLDTNHEKFQDSVKIISIEPRPERLKALLHKDDNIRIIEKELQDVDLTVFDNLNNGDFLIIDSSHVSKIRSDVNYIFFEILPLLNKGVYIHFHDIFYPFIYPKEWVFQGRAYNEMYMLRTFLMNNKDYSVQFFGEMMEKEHKDECLGKDTDLSGSIWLRKD